MTTLESRDAADASTHESTMTVTYTSAAERDTRANAAARTHVRRLRPS